MIRINLLPVRAAKKKETAIQQLAIAGISFGLVLAIILVMFFIKLGQISGTKNDITAANAKIAELKSKIGKLDELKKLKDEVKKKLDVLAELRKNKSGPAQRLATLSDSTPDQLWLESYKEAGGTIKIAGLAMNEELIAQFIRALEASADYERVDLVVSEQKDLSGTKVKRFELTLQLERAKPVEPIVPAAEPKKK
jgi:type IV pilus assembly protein PilN